MSLNLTSIGCPIHQSLFMYSFWIPRREKKINRLVPRARISTLTFSFVLNNCIFFYTFVMYIDAVIRFSFALSIVQNLLVL